MTPSTENSNEKKAKTAKSLSNDKKKSYRAIGHELKPIVTIAGNGLTKNVSAEIERALCDHELIKIKIAVEDRELRKSVITTVCADSKSELVQVTGKVALIFRKSTKETLKTSNIR